MRVEGISISAIARITGRSRSTIMRWLERAAASAKHFNEKCLIASAWFDFEVVEVDVGLPVVEA